MSPRLRAPRRARVLLALCALAAAACAEEGGRLSYRGTLDLFDHVGEEAERRAGGTAIANFPEQRDRLMEETKSERVFLTELVRAIVFDGFRVPGTAELVLSIRVEPPEAYAGDRLGALFRARTTDGVVHTATAVLTRPAGGGWLEVRHPLELSGEVDRLEVGFPPRGPAAEGALLAVARPRLEFPAEVVRRRKDEPRQALLVTLDTVRRGALGCYGAVGARTPALDALARDGARFDGAFSVTNGTNPAHVSIFSSLHLKDHAVKDNFTRLDPECPTFPDVLRDAGFRTAAFTASFSFLPERCGLETRFDDYYPCRIYHERRAEDVNQELLPWLARHHEDDFFVWVHYFDAHMPYDPPPPFDDGFEVPGDDPVEREVYAELPESFTRSQRLQDYVAAYRGEVAYLDARIGELVAHLKALEIYDRATIVVVGDHGESLGENRIYFDHVGLFDPVTAVPLLVKPPGGAGGRVVPGLVSILDVHPTLLELCGVANPQDVRGRSLVPALAGAPAGEERLFFEAGRGEAVGLRTERWLCTLERVDRALFPGFVLRAGRVRLFDLAADPAETTDVAASNAELVAAFRRELEAFPDDSRGYEPEPIDDPEYLERLRKLGYVR